MLRGWDPTSKDVGVQDMFHHSGHANLKGLCCLRVHGDIWHRTLKRTMSGTMVLLQPISVLSVVQDLGLHLWPVWDSRTIQIWAVWTDNWDHGILWTKQPGPWLSLWSCLSLGLCWYPWLLLLSMTVRRSTPHQLQPSGEEVHYLASAK